MYTGKKLGDAIKQVMELKGVTQAQVARDFGVKPPSVYAWIKEGKISKEHLSKLLEYFSDVVGAEQFGLEPSNTMPTHLSIGAIEEQDDLSAYTDVELYDVKLSAGNGTATWVARQEEPLLFRRAWMKKRGFSSEDCKGMYVRGDSMEPELKDWDTVLIDTSDIELVTGEIYAVAYKDRVFIKEARVRPESIELVSLNPKYESIIIPNSELKDFQVLGRKVWRGG